MKYLMAIFVGLFIISCKPTIRRQPSDISEPQRLINNMLCDYHYEKDVCVCIIRDGGVGIGMAIDPDGIACE